MNKEDFETLALEAIKLIPQKFLNKLSNVVITIQDKPDKWQLQSLKMGEGYYLLGLYEGIPQSQRRHYTNVLPDKITLFQKNIEREGKGETNLIKKIIKNTIWHEIAHHFGFDELELSQIEMKNEEPSPKFNKK